MIPVDVFMYFNNRGNWAGNVEVEDDNDLDDIGLIVISEDEGIDFEDPKDAFDPRDVNRSYRLKPENTHAEVNDTICVKVHAYDGTSFYRVDPDKKLSSYGT